MASPNKLKARLVCTCNHVTEVRPSPTADCGDLSDTINKCPHKDCAGQITGWSIQMLDGTPFKSVGDPIPYADDPLVIDDLTILLLNEQSVDANAEHASA
ncbi:MAG: hypothetical protein WC289_00045 [Patescibacteria group bacterium]